MARPTLNRNPKYLALVKRLASVGIHKSEVRGCLEHLWDSAHECGDPVFNKSHHIEAAAEWEGEAGVFVNALIEEGFLDQTNEDTLEIHDYWDHAPEYVRKRKNREDERVRNSKFRRKIERRTTTGNSEKQWTVADNGSPPSLSPSPTPPKEKKTAGQPENDEIESEQSAFESCPEEAELQREAANLANHFHVELQSSSKPSLDELRIEMAAKLRHHGLKKAACILEHIKDPKRDKTLGKTIKMIYLFWNTCPGLKGENGNESRNRSGHASKGAGAKPCKSEGRYEGLNANSIDLSDSAPVIPIAAAG